MAGCAIGLALEKVSVLVRPQTGRGRSNCLFTVVHAVDEFVTQHHGRRGSHEPSELQEYTVSIVEYRKGTTTEL